MLRHPAVFLVLGLLLPVLSPKARAAEVPVEVEVRRVSFSVLQNRDGWHETIIELAVNPVASATQYVDRVGVRLNLAYASPRDGSLRFYRAEAEAVTVRSGRAFWRFYLPPSVVARDRLTGRMEYFSVEVAVAGRPQPPVAAAVAEALRTPGRLKNFLTRADAESPANAGVLVPQPLSPFAWDQQKPAPDFFRINVR